MKGADGAAGDSVSSSINESESTRIRGSKQDWVDQTKRHITASVVKGNAYNGVYSVDNVHMCISMNLAFIFTRHLRRKWFERQKGKEKKNF